jgi:hypothetical protein
MTVEMRFLGVSFRRLVAVSWRTVAAALVMSTAVKLVQGIFLPESGFVGMTIGITLVTATGAAVYLGALFGLWVMARRPKGPEMSMLDLARQVARTMRK